MYACSFFALSLKICLTKCSKTDLTGSRTPRSTVLRRVVGFRIRFGRIDHDRGSRGRAPLFRRRQRRRVGAEGEGAIRGGSLPFHLRGHRSDESLGQSGAQRDVEDTVLVPEFAFVHRDIAFRRVPRRRTVSRRLLLLVGAARDGTRCRHVDDGVRDARLGTAGVHGGPRGRGLGGQVEPPGGVQGETERDRNRRREDMGGSYMGTEIGPLLYILNFEFFYWCSVRYYGLLRFDTEDVAGCFQSVSSSFILTDWRSN